LKRAKLTRFVCKTLPFSELFIYQIICFYYDVDCEVILL
jgi:hypothetical protein